MHEYKNKVRVYKKEEHELLPGQFFSDEPGVYIEVLYNAVFIFCQRLVYVVFFKWFTMSLQPGWVRDQAGDSPEVFSWKAQSQYIVITIPPLKNDKKYAAAAFQQILWCWHLETYSFVYNRVDIYTGWRKRKDFPILL